MLKTNTILHFKHLVSLFSREGIILFNHTQGKGLAWELMLFTRFEYSIQYILVTG